MRSLGLGLKAEPHDQVRRDGEPPPPPSSSLPPLPPPSPPPLPDFFVMVSAQRMSGAFRAPIAKRPASESRAALVRDKGYSVRFDRHRWPQQACLRSTSQGGRSRDYGPTEAARSARRRPRLISALMYIIITFIIRWLSEAKTRSGRARQHPKQECRSEWRFTVDAAFDAIDKGAHEVRRFLDILLRKNH